jgi:hypothetical protein
MVLWQQDYGYWLALKLAAIFHQVWFLASLAYLDFSFQGLFFSPTIVHFFLSLFPPFFGHKWTISIAKLIN